VQQPFDHRPHLLPLAFLVSVVVLFLMLPAPADVPGAPTARLTHLWERASRESIRYALPQTENMLMYLMHPGEEYGYGGLPSLRS
jgi:hypothetical protein